MFNILLNSKKYLILVLILLGILLLSLMLSFSTSTSPAPSTTPRPSTLTTNNLPSLTPNQEEPNPYQTQQLNADFRRIVERKELSSSDTQARQQLTYLTEGMSGPIRTTTGYQIEYLKSANSFMVEIRTNNADEAKNQATAWLKEQGLSTEGICNLPVVFYLNNSVRSHYSQNNLEFNPVPEGCP